MRNPGDGGSTAETVMINLKKNNEIMRRPIRAESAIMHPTEPIIALRAQKRTLQLFNLDTKEKLQNYTHNEDILYWRWISQTTLALVSTKSVFHWDVIESNAAQPFRVFDRHENLEVRIASACYLAAAADISIEQPDHQLRY